MGVASHITEESDDTGLADMAPLLCGCVALVTNADSCLGQACAHNLAVKGARVVLKASDKTALETILPAIQRHTEAVAVITSSNNEEQLLQTALDNFESLDLIITSGTPENELWVHLLKQGFGNVVSIVCGAGISPQIASLGAQGAIHNVHINAIIVPPGLPDTLVPSVALQIADLLQHENLLNGQTFEVSTSVRR